MQPGLPVGSPGCEVPSPRHRQRLPRRGGRAIRGGGGGGAGRAMEIERCGAALLLAGLGRGGLLFLLPLFLLLLVLLLWVCSRPLVVRRGPGQVGYLPVPGLSRKQAARRARRYRRPGALPPPYPNGWYRLLDSAQLPRGAVRSLSLLGE